MSGAKKRFGQHFLTSQRALTDLVRLIGSNRPGKDLVEIGPGRGALTQALLQAGFSVRAIEIDRDLVPRLEQFRGEFPGRFEFVLADVLNFDFATLGDRVPLRLVGNLPYNISSPILFHLIEFVALIGDMHFMFQKEVAERIVAAPDTEAYGRLSVMIQYYFSTDYLFSLPPGAFSPPPKVDSAVVRFQPITARSFTATDPQHFAGLVKQAFSQRRKTLRNALSQWVTHEQFEIAGINPQWRAEVLSTAQFVTLSNVCCEKPAPPPA